MRRKESADISKHIFVKIAFPVMIRKKIKKEKIINLEEAETEETHCSFFGCAKPLSLLEKLCGDRCIKHPKQVKDITNCISI